MPNLKQPLTVKWVKVPPARRGFVGWILFLIVIFVSYLFVFLISLFVLGLLFQRLPGPSGLRFGVASALSFLMAGIGPIISYQFLEAFRRRYRYRRTRRHSPERQRLDRLTAVVNHAEAMPRAVSRLVEYEIRTHGGRSRKLAEILNRAGPGLVIVVTTVGWTSFPRHVPTDARFEPIDLEQDNERLAWLGDQVWEAAQQTYPLNQTDVDIEPSALLIRDKLGVLVKWLFGIVGCLGLAYMAYSTVRFPASTDAYLFCGFFLLMVLLALGGLLADSTWWLVPGGLVFRRRRAWRRNVQVRLITPAESSLIVVAGGGAFVLDRGRLRGFNYPHWCDWALIAGWMSTAPTPSRDEILAFVGPDAEWMD